MAFHQNEHKTQSSSFTLQSAVWPSSDPPLPTLFSWRSQLSSCLRILALMVSTAAFFFFFFFFLHCEACVISVLWLGIKPPLLAIEVWSLNDWTAGEVTCSASFHKLSLYYHSVLSLNVSSSERSWRAPKCKEGSHWLSMKVKMLVAQSCPTLCNPKDRSPPGSSVHGILQARVLECVAIPFSRGSSWPRDWTQVSCIAGRFFTVWATREALGITLL